MADFNTSPPASDPYTSRVVRDLLEGRLSLLNTQYTSILLTNRAIPRLTDEAMPTSTLERTCFSLYWPGGHPNHGASFETIAYGRDFKSESEAMSQAMELRQLILGASIGSSALGRIDKAVRDLSRTYSEKTSHRPAEVLSGVCAALGLPLVVVMMGEVRLDTETPDVVRNACMLYPMPLSPPKALAVMQNAVRKVIASEEI